MSIRSLAETLGQTVFISTPGVSTDNVYSPKYTWSTIDPDTSYSVKAYVADYGSDVSMVDDRLEGPRSITVYIPGNNTTVTMQTRLKIGSTYYRVGGIKYPGMRTVGPLAYTVVQAVSDSKVASQ